MRNLTKDEKEKYYRMVFSSKSTRVKYLENDFLGFAVYYFQKYFTSEIAEFHKEWVYEFLGERDMVLEAFRGAGKTRYTIIFIIFCICFSRYHFIIFFSFNASDSKSKLFEIIVEMQGNRKILNDFGDIIPGRISVTGTKTKNTSSQIISTNDVKVQALSIGTSCRGLVHNQYRPELVVFDDVDVFGSVQNVEIIQKNFDFILNEVFGTIGTRQRYIFLGNTIYNDGVLRRVIQRDQKNKNVFISRVPVERDGKVLWSDRYTKTAQEAEERLKQGKECVSIETIKQKQVSEEGEDAFLANMYLIPMSKKGRMIFSRDILEKTPFISGVSSPICEGLRTFKEPDGIYYIGIDPAEGLGGGDFTGIYALDSHLDTIFTFKGKIGVENIVEVLGNCIGDNKNCTILIERNNHGHAFIHEISKSIEYSHLLKREKTIDKINNTYTNKAGFNTTQTSKFLLVNTAKKFLNTSRFASLDERLKQELLVYIEHSNGSIGAMSGEHDDLATSFFLALFCYSEDFL